MNPSTSTHHSFPWSHSGIDYIVEFTYFAPFVGGRDGGVQVEPGGGDEVEVRNIKTEDWGSVTGREFADLSVEAEKAAWNYLKSQSRR